MHDPYDICACAQLRKAARALTQRYDAALRPSGLKVTQFSILRILANEGEANMTALAERMALERTTLTRNLGPLERDGFVEVVTGEDPRSRVARITSNGRRALADAEVYWQDTQRHVIGSLGPEQATRMFDDLSEITQVARD